MRRTLAVVGVATVLVATGCRSGGTYDAAAVRRAFRAEGLVLERNRDLERSFRSSRRSLRARVADLLGASVPTPKAILSGRDQVFVAVLSRPLSPQEVVGANGHAVAALEGQGLRLFRRGNVFAMVGVEEPRRLRQVRAALNRLR